MTGKRGNPKFDEYVTFIPTNHVVGGKTRTKLQPKPVGARRLSAEYVNGEVLAQLIADQFGTQAAFAKTTRIDDASLSRFIGGKLRATWPNRYRMARALGVSVDDITKPEVVA